MSGERRNERVEIFFLLILNINFILNLQEALKNLRIFKWFNSSGVKLLHVCDD